MAYQVECSLEYIPSSISLLAMQYIALAHLATNIENGSPIIVFLCRFSCNQSQEFVHWSVQECHTRPLLIVHSDRLALVGLRFQINHIGGVSE